jgi:hypothetical protein
MTPNLFGDEEPEAPAGPKGIEVYVDSFGVSTCTGANCRKRILWAEVVRSGRKMCFDDPEIVALRSRHEPATHRLIYEFPLDGNHWAHCPDRDRFKR